MNSFTLTTRLSDEATVGRLSARPQPVFTAAPVGVRTLPFQDLGEGLIYVPTVYRIDHPTPLVVLLHGAGGKAHDGLNLLQSVAETAGLILLAPSSQGSTWDIIEDGYGPDVDLLNRALEQVFHSYAIDTRHIAIGGFSDGASYALSLGLTNGDLFTHILAFSPGFMAPFRRHGKPHIFISHGTTDRVLPIDRCSRRLVPALERSAYPVRYHEFEGPHIIPPAIVHEAVDWLLGVQPRADRQPGVQS